jgi:hypothetical protein
MARARNIKPGFYKNEDLAECSPWARLIFPGLWMLADREGRMEDRPKRIKGELLPYDAIDVDPLLEELSRWGFILRYEVNGERFIQVLKFNEHQAPHVREAASTIPSPGSTGVDTMPAQDKEGASTNLGSAQASPRSPDFLNPESPLLNPEPKAEAPQRRSTDATATRLPADWSADDADIEFCKANRPDLVPSEVADRFRDYWIAQPGAKGRKTDWPATWRNWVRNEKQQARASPRQAQQANTNRLLDRINGNRNHEPDPRIIDINDRPS